MLCVYIYIYVYNAQAIYFWLKTRTYTTTYSSSSSSSSKKLTKHCFMKTKFSLEKMVPRAITKFLLPTTWMLWCQTVWANHTKSAATLNDSLMRNVENGSNMNVEKNNMYYESCTILQSLCIVVGALIFIMLSFLCIYLFISLVLSIRIRLLETWNKPLNHSVHDANRRINNTRKNANKRNQNRTNATTINNNTTANNPRKHKACIPDGNDDIELPLVNNNNNNNNNPTTIIHNKSRQQSYCTQV